MIKGYSNYETDIEGRVYSLNYKNKKGYKKELVQFPNKSNGYYYVNLCKNGKYKAKKVSRLVAEEWVEIPEHLKDFPIEKLHVDHIDGDITNNKACNLRWCTQLENNNFPLYRKHRSEAMKNNGCHNKMVDQINKEGEIVKTYKSAMEASKEFGIEYSYLGKVLRNGYIGKGYYWKYKTNKGS